MLSSRRTISRSIYIRTVQTCFVRREGIRQVDPGKHSWKLWSRKDNIDEKDSEQGHQTGL